MLFLVGIGSMFKLVHARYVLVSVGTGLLVAAIVLIVLQPGLLHWCRCYDPPCPGRWTSAADSLPMTQMSEEQRDGAA